MPGTCAAGVGGEDDWAAAVKGFHPFGQAEREPFASVPRSRQFRAYTTQAYYQELLAVER